MSANELKRGDTWVRTFQFRNNGVPVDLSGCTARFQVRQSGKGVLIASGSTETGEVQVDAVEGNIHVRIPSSQTADAPLCVCFAELEVTWPDSTVQSTPAHSMRVVADVVR